MRKMIVTALLALSVLSAEAGEFRIASIFSDGMVVQRETSVPMWGWAEPGAKVTVEASWGSRRTCMASSDSCWRVELPSPAAGGPHSITFTAKEPSYGKTSLTISDVSSGEVWICGGQSNMDMPLKGWGEQYIDGAMEAMMDAPRHASRIRVFHITADTASVPQRDVEARWMMTDMKTAGNTSALAYFFARRIEDMLDVPVGIVVNPWGGSRIQTWMPREDVENAICEAVGPERLRMVLDRKQMREGCPDVTAACYNGRFFPIKGYAAKGFLWYQGESDRADHDIYDDLLTALAARLRKDWGDADASMPFMYVTMAPWEDVNFGDIPVRPLLVEAQLSCLKTIPNSYAAVTETLGSRRHIHPPYKREVADQLALLAYSEVYGMDPGVSVGFPYPESVEYRSGEVRVVMKNCNGGLVCCKGEEVEGFEVAGADGVFHKAAAEISDGCCLKVWSGNVPEPVAVRYAFSNYSEANLRSSFGIPVPSFRM